MKKKSLALFLYLVMVFSVFSMTVFASEFTDMPDNWSTPALEKAVANGLLKGDKGKIRAEDSLTRAEMATIVNRSFQSTKASSLKAFTDVRPGDWYYKEMGQAVGMQTFRGTGDKLNPNDNITREEAFVVLARAFKVSEVKKGVLDKFYDKNHISTWAKNEVSALVSAGYIAGSNGQINPKENITRAEFAQIMDNLVKTYITNEGEYSKDYKGHVMINQAGVTLKGLTIDGDLIIGDGVGDGDVTLDGVTLKGRLVVRGGGEKSIKIIGNSNVKKIIVARVGGKVRVYTEVGVEIGEVIVDGFDDVILEGEFDSVRLIAEEVTVFATNTNIESAEVVGRKSRIILGKDSNIDNIVVNADDVTIEGQGKIKEVLANGNNIVVTVIGTKVTQGYNAKGAMAGDKEVLPGKTEIVGAEAIIPPAPPAPGGGGGTTTPTEPPVVKVNAINITGDFIYGSTLTATPAPSGSTGTYQWKRSDSADGTYVDIVGASQKTYTLSSEDTGKFIKVELTGNGIYRGTVTSIATVEIKAIPLTVTAADEIKTYDGTALVKNEATATGLVDGHILESVTVTGTQTLVGTSANLASTAKILDENNNDVTANYALTYIDGTLTITKANIALTVIANSDTKVYTGSEQTLTGYADPVGLLEGHELSGVTASGSGTNVGEYSVIFTGDAVIKDAASNNVTENYAVTLTPGNFNIMKKDLIATATVSEKVYDGNRIGIGSIDLLGVVVSEDVTATGTFAFDDKNVGTGKIVNVSNIILAGVDAGNYTVNSTTSTTANITPITLVATATANNRVYDGTVDATGDITLSGVLSGEIVSATGTFIFDNKNAGTEKTVNVSSIILAGADAGNYTVDSTTSTKANITPITLSTTATANDKIYDGSMIGSGSISLEGVVSGEDVTVTGTFAFDSKNAGTDKTVTVADIILAGVDAANYTVDSTTSTKANITPITLSTTATANNRVYDGTVNATGDITLSGALSGETVKATGTFAFDNENAGTGKTVNVSNINLVGDAYAGNYTVNATTTTKASITPKVATISVDNLTIEYGTDYTEYTFKGTVEGLISPRDLGTITYKEITGGKNSDGNLNANDVAYTGLTVKYDQNNNYDVVVTSGRLTVTKKVVTITAASKNFTYDGSLQSYKSYEIDGLVGSDKITPVIVGSINYPTQSPVINQVTTYALTVIDPNNYIVKKVNGELTMDKASIDLTVTANSVSKVYDGTILKENGYEHIGTLANGDELEVIINGEITDFGKTQNEVKSVVVKNKGIDVTENYNITKVNGELEIKARLVKIIAESASKTYDGTPLTASYMVEGLVNPDTIVAEVKATVTNVGTEDNIVTKYTINTANVNNYIVEKVNGKLEVIPRKVTVNSIPSSTTYNGNEHSLVNYNIDAITGNEGLVGSHVLSGLVATKHINAGTYNEASFDISNAKIVDNNNIEVTSNYEVKVNPATLTIEKKILILTANSVTAVYTGSEQTVTGYAEPVGLLTDHVLSGITANGSGANVGEYAVIFTGTAVIKDASYDVTNNYQTDYINGKLTIVGKDLEENHITVVSPIASSTAYAKESLTTENTSFDSTSALVQSYGTETILGTWSKVSVNTSTGQVKLKFTVNSGGNYKGTIEMEVEVILSQAAPTNLVGIAPTSVSSKDGKISGTTTGMEYLSTESDWTPVTIPEISGLIPGTYQVRFKAKTGYNASPITPVKVLAYVKSSDATLKDLTIAGTTVTGFAAATLTYNIELAAGTTTVPTVVATVKDTGKANAVVTAAASLPGSTNVVVTAENGTIKTYTVNFTVKSLFEYTSSGVGITITGYNGTDTSVNIPSTINKLPVRAIGDSAFRNKGLTSVTIPEGVTIIGVSAFRENSLTSVTIPEGVTIIGGAAFTDNKLTSVTIPSSVVTIGGLAFQENKLRSVTFAEGLKEIKEYAFRLNYLTLVTIPETCTIIDPEAFTKNGEGKDTLNSPITKSPGGPGTWVVNDRYWVLQ